MRFSVYTYKPEDDLDSGEEYTRSGVDIAKIIAISLNAVINVNNFK